jgi:hypothetical protein
VILDPNQGIHASRVPPEHRLIVSNINRAVLDLFSKVMLTSTPDEATVIKHDALRFLTATGGPWATRRRELCVEIGYCPDHVRSSIIAILNGRNLKTLDERYSFNDIENARKLWGDQKLASEAAQTARLARAATIAERREAAREKEAIAQTHAPKAALHDALGGGPVARVAATLFDRPLTIRQIGFALDGNLDTVTIRKWLLQAQDKGFVRRDGPEWTLSLPKSIAA